MKRLVAVGVLVVSAGCATIGMKGQLDQSVIVGLVCSGRESEAKQYVLERKYKYSDIVERIEWARKECK